MTEAIEPSAAKTLRDIMAATLELNTYGFGKAYGRPLNQPHFDGFEKAVAWLRQFPKTKQFSRKGTSYGLKHVAEPEIGYTANGIFIAAAIHAGFRIQRVDYDHPNAFLNISAKAWRLPVGGLRYRPGVFG